MRQQIDAVLADSVLSQTRTSIKIVSLDSKEVIYERESRMLMRPASNLKLLTSATAIVELGKDFVFKTVVARDSPIVQGKLRGNLYLKGYGNPDLVTSDLDSIAASLKAMGLSEVLGDVVADVSYFDDLYWGNGWMWDDEPESDEMFISPVSLNDNCVRVTATPGTFDGDSVTVTVTPITTYLTMRNTARTVKDSVSQSLRISRLFKERLNTIRVEGQMRAGDSPIERQLSIWRPELYAAQVFKETLMRNGIMVRGRISSDTASGKRDILHTHARPLDSVIVHLNKVSDNLSAENTLKVLSAEKWGPPGRASSGLTIVKRFLSSLGIDTTRYVAVDGSGVSHYNLLTAEMLVQLLEGITRRDDIFPIFYRSLPIAGVDGTLKNRMKGTRAEGNLRAKTGSLSGVSSLSGYVRSRDGETFVFSILMQSFIGSAQPVRNVQDSIGVLLANFSRLRGIASASQ